MAMWQDTAHASAGARHTSALFARYDDEVVEVTRTEDSFGSVGQQSPATTAYFDGFIDGYQSVDPRLSHVEELRRERADGKTEFVGSFVVRELITAGHDVVGLSRSDAGAEKLARVGAKVFRGDVNDLDALRDATEAADGKRSPR